MAIAFRAASTLVDNTGTSITVTKPAGLTIGDFVAVIFAQTTTTSTVISPPDNSWYQAPLQDNQLAGDDVRVAIYYHLAVGSEPTWTFTLGTSIRVVARSVAYSGVGSLDICSWAMGAASTAATSTTATATNASDTVLCFVVNNDNGGGAGITLDGSLTSRFNSTTGDGHYTLAMGDATATGTSVPAYHNTTSSNQVWFVPVLALSVAGAMNASANNVGPVPTATAQGSSTANVPAGIQNGDILVTIVSVKYTFSGSSTQTTIITPGGWTKIDEEFVNPTTGTFTLHGAFYTHLVTNVGSEPSGYTWNTSGGSSVGSMDTIMVAVRGVSALDTFTTANSGGADVSSVTVPGITVATDNEPVLIVQTTSSDSGGPNPDCVGLQVEGFQRAVAVWSTVGGLTGAVTPSQTTTTSGVAEQLLAYQIGFKASVTNSVKIIGTTVVNRYSAVNSQAITVPSSTTTRDVLLAHVMCVTGGTITPPAGWTAITNALADNGSVLAQAFYHVVGVGDPSSVTFSFSGSSTGCASIIALRNVTSGGISASNSTTQGLTPTLTSVLKDSLVLMYETCTNSAAAVGTTVGLPKAMFLTPFVYNPNGNNGGNINRGGALSVILQTGASGGSIGAQYRSAAGSISGPQMTIAVPFAAPNPTPPPTPPPIPPPPGPGPNLPFVYKGRIAALTNIPPVKNWHDLNKILQQKFVNELPKLITQVVKFASNPQQHYKAVSQPLPTVEQTDVTTSDATSGAPAPVISSDVADTFPSTGFVSTLGAGVTVTTVSIPNNTPTSVVTANPIIPMNPGDLVMAVVTGNWAVALYSGIMDITYAGTPSGIIYFQKRINVDSGGNFSDTQIFTAPAGLANDTGLVFGTSQGSGGSVNITTCTFYVGNLQLR